MSASWLCQDKPEVFSRAFVVCSSSVQHKCKEISEVGLRVEVVHARNPSITQVISQFTPTRRSLKTCFFYIYKLKRNTFGYLKGKYESYVYINQEILFCPNYNVLTYASQPQKHKTVCNPLQPVSCPIISTVFGASGYTSYKYCLHVPGHYLSVLLEPGTSTVYDKTYVLKFD